MPGLAHDPPLHLARAADREDVRRAEAQRGGDGRVLAQAAVEVELAVDAHGREEQRDRGARERVVRADAVGAEERARRRGRRDREVGRGLHEDDRAARGDLGARDRQRAQHVLAQAPRDGAPADLALHELGHRRARRRGPYPSPPAEQDARQRHHLPHAEAEHARELELAPQLDEPAQPEHGIAQVRGEVAGVDGADARAAEDVDLRRRAEHARELVEDVPEHAHLVRAARPAARQDHRDAALAGLCVVVVAVMRVRWPPGCRRRRRGCDGSGVVSNRAAFMGRCAKSLRIRASRTVSSSACA